MPFDSHTARTRSTTATRRRDDNVRRIITALRAGPLLRDEVRDLLGNSRSGTNKYMHMLRADGLVEIERYIDPSPTSPGHPVYRLNAKPGIVEAYLAGLDAAVTRINQARPLVMPKASYLHQLADDMHHAFRRAPLAIPPHTPLMVAFYGMDQQPAA